MNDVYTVGALGDLISSIGKNKKTKTGKIKKDNFISDVQSETCLKDSSNIKNVEIFNEEKLLISPNKLKRKKKDKLIKSNDNTEIFKEDKSPITPNKLKRKKKDKLIKPNDKVELFKEEKSPLIPNKLKRKKKDKLIKPNDKVEILKEEKSPLSPNKLKRKANDKLIKPNDNTEIFKEDKSPITPNKLKRIKKNKLIKPINNSGEKIPVSKLEAIKSSEEYLEKELRTIFVGNVPVNVKMSAIKKLFKQFGEIETTRLRSVAVKSLNLPRRVSIIKGNFHPQRDTANVYVRFKTKDAAQKALCLNSTKFEQHTIRVDMSLNTDHKQNKKKAIFIGNLPYSIQEDEVWDFFRGCGVVSAVRVVRDSSTGVSKGFGFVDFESKESVEFAMQLQGNKIQNREIRIKRIDTKTNSKNMTKVSLNKTPVQFKRTRPSKNITNFQGEKMKSKLQKKKGKPTKTDLRKKKIAKQLNA